MQICLFVNGPVWYAILIIREQEVLACKWDFVCCRCPCVVSFTTCNSEKVLGSGSSNWLLRRSWRHNLFVEVCAGHAKTIRS